MLCDDTSTAPREKNQSHTHIYREPVHFKVVQSANKISGEGLGVGDTLQSSVHEARVAEIVQAASPIHCHRYHGTDMYTTESVL